MAQSKPPFPAKDLDLAGGVPIIGPWIARLGYAADIFAMPCNPTPTAWVYGFAAAGLKMYVSFKKPFNLAETFQALAGKGRSHGFKKGGVFSAGGFSKRGLGYIQALEEIGPAKKFVKTAAGHVFYIVGDLAVKAEWYFFIADVTSDGLLNWVTQAYKWQGCIPDNGSTAEGTSHGDILIAGGGAYSRPNIQWQVQAPIVPEYNAIAVPPGWDLSLHATASFVQYRPGVFPPMKTQPRITIVTDRENQPRVRSGLGVTAAGEWTATASVRIRAEKDNGVQVGVWYIQDNDQAAECTSLLAQGVASTNLKDSLLPDP